MSNRHDRRESLVILGSGWGADVLLRYLDPVYQTTVVTPSPYFSFTPLLASTAVGNVSARSVVDATKRHGVTVYSATAERIDIASKQVECKSAVGAQSFTVKYDILVVATGCDTADFGTEGAREHAIFFKTVQDAMKVRNRLLARFEEAALPDVPAEDRKRLLHFGVVGGGATGIELTAELTDLVQGDMAKMYPDLVGECKITVYDVADTILPGFDSDLQQHAQQHFSRSNVEVQTGSHITKVAADYIEVKELGRVPLGMLVWSTGLAPYKLMSNGVERAKQDEKTKNLIVDDRLRVMTDSKDDEAHKNVFAIGDVATLASGALPPVGAAADQEARFLARQLNARATGKPFDDIFHFQESTKISYLGNQQSVSQKGDSSAETGRGAWALWRESYARTLSTKRRISLAFNWLFTSLFGRDLVRM